VANNEFRAIVKEAVDYVKTHFTYEEEIMRKTQFPEYTKHKTEHEEFVKTVLQEVRNFEEGKLFVPNHFGKIVTNRTERKYI